MLTQMTDTDWEIVVAAFLAARSRRGGQGRDDRKFLEALHYFTVHNITWRALPAEFGKWNSIWKRFWRLSQRGVFRGYGRHFGRNERYRAPRSDGRFDSRARPCLGGRRKRGQEGQALGRSRGGFSTKIHLKTDSTDCRWLSTSPAVRPAIAAISKSCSTSVRTSRRGRFSATRVTTPRPTARRHAGAASVPPSLTERTPPQSRLSFPKSSTRGAPASSKASAKSSASNGSPYAARRPPRTSPPSSPSPACLSWSNPSTPPSLWSHVVLSGTLASSPGSPSPQHWMIPPCLE